MHPTVPPDVRFAMQSIQIRANGLTFGALSLGDGPRLALLLHGFPDNARSMMPLMRHLVAAGYRTVAPYLRGYGPSDLSPVDDYRVPTLGRDVIGWIRALGDGPALVVGHDWGAISAWSAAVQEPDALSHCVCLAVPPLNRFPDLYLEHPSQVAASLYFLRLGLRPDAPKRLLARDGAWLRQFWRDWSPGWMPDDARLDDIVRTYRRPGTARAATLYYRQILPWVDSLGWHRDVMAPARKPSRVPALVIGGGRDRCLLPLCFEGLQSSFLNRGEVVMLPDAGHFVHLQDHQAVASHILRFVES